MAMALGGCVRSPSPSSVSELLTFLMAVQSAALASFGGGPNFDPKYYVDLPLKFPVNVTIKVFGSLPRSENDTIASDTLQHFLKDYFSEPESDLIPDTPLDYHPNPPNFLPLVRNSKARKWALQVHSLWLILARQVAPKVEREPDQHTLLPLKKAIVVPGARFREVYYWDSYWVIRGLLVSKMVDTAKGMVENLLALAEIYGFVPNGARTYYENRSMMVHAIYIEDGNRSLVERALPVLLREHKFWTSEPHQVVVQDSRGTQHRLSRYYANWDKPRPESSTIDMGIAKGMRKDKQAQLYRDIATAAESGWDFSSRWMADQQNLSSLRTSSIVPVDLNSFLLQSELNIAFFANATGDNATHQRFSNAAKARKLAIDSILWNEERGQWFDYWLPLDSSEVGSINDQKCLYGWDSGSQNRHIYASNFVPLWCGVLSPRDARLGKVMDALTSSGLLHPAGIATSLKETGQQWDFPNAWAPLQHMIIEGLASKKSHRSKKLAQDIARRWLSSNFAAFESIGKMIEKYDVRYCGKTGGGGEYNPQTGFGWTNGVVLALLQKFGWPADHSLSCR